MIWSHRCSSRHFLGVQSCKGYFASFSNVAQKTFMRQTFFSVAFGTLYFPLPNCYICLKVLRFSIPIPMLRSARNLTTSWGRPKVASFSEGPAASLTRVKISARQGSKYQSDKGQNISQTRVKISARQGSKYQPDKGQNISQTRVKISARQGSKYQPDKGQNISQTRVKISVRHATRFSQLHIYATNKLRNVFIQTL